MREITETDEFEKLVGAGGNQIILRKYFDILAVFFGCKSIPISLSQLVFCSIKNKIIEHKNHTESYSLKRSQIFPFPAHCLKQSKTGRDTSRQVKTNQAAFAVSSFSSWFIVKEIISIDRCWLCKYVDMLFPMLGHRLMF